MKYLLALLLPAAAFAGIWPENFGAFRRTAVQPADVSDRALWDEYSLQQSEQAQYESATQHFTAVAYRLQDSTGAYAAFEWQRPADAIPTKLGKLTAKTPDGLLMAHGNYLLIFKGRQPQVTEIDALYQTLPELDSSPLPTLSGYLPEDHLVANSERYVTGPVGLERFDSGVPPASAAFHLGAEAQLGVFRAAGGNMTLAVFSYPTPQIARERLVDFQRISGAMVKRTGPLLAVILAPRDSNEAERLLGKVRYEPTITWNERVPTRRDNIGDLVINAFELIGILLVFCVVAGVSYGGFRAFRRRSAAAGGGEAMIMLHLSDQ
ncbi:MAG: hypothetical protein DMG57_25295 [Acidobacteria bacterium]|nr:MAG: hypothetical protein DMG57_25295 [Acidobacteriota bacterium]